MARSLVAYYDSVYLAQKAVDELTTKGFSKEMITLLVPASKAGKERLRPVKRSRSAEQEVMPGSRSAGAQAGAAIGSALGAASLILMITRVLPIPGLEVVSLYEPARLAVTVTGELGALTLIGAGLGALLGSLVGLGIPEEELHQYAKNIRCGSVLVSILADWDRVDQAIEILNHHRPLQVKEERISRERIEQMGGHLFI